MKSIGFDGWPDCEDFPASDVAGLLATIARELRRRGKTSRDLQCIVFSVPTGQVEVTLRPDPLSAGYPSLGTIMGEITRTCAMDGIGASQFRRLDLSEDEVRLELVDVWGQPETYLYPVLSASLDA